MIYALFVHGLCTVNALVYGLSVWLPMQLHALAVRCLRDTNAAGAVPTRCLRTVRSIPTRCLYDARAISL